MTDHELLKSILAALGMPNPWPISNERWAIWMDARVPVALLEEARARVGFSPLNASPDFSGNSSVQAAEVSDGSTVVQTASVSGNSVVVQTRGDNRVIVNGVDVTDQVKKP